MRISGVSTINRDQAAMVARNANERVADVEDENDLRAVATLICTASEAVATGLALLRANEDTLQKEEA